MVPSINQLPGGPIQTRFTTHVHLDPHQRTALISLLNHRLASAVDLQMQLKQAHWNLRGPWFMARHELFDAVAARMREHSDDIAERIGALGGYARGSVRMAAHDSGLPAVDEEAVSGEACIAQLVDRMSTFARTLREGIEQSASIGDPATEDLMTGMLRAVEQDLWFLESHIHPGAAEAVHAGSFGNRQTLRTQAAAEAK